MSPSRPSSSPLPRFGRLLLTGAAGQLGRELRQRLRPYCDRLRVSDLSEMAPPVDDHEEVVRCDLADAAAVRALLDGVDGVVHFGGVSVEAAWEPILQANIVGVKNLYEAARLNRTRRVVFASSNHVVGMYSQGQVLDVDAAPRPDGYYGLSKAFGEDTAQLYFDRHGVETVSIRIGSVTPAPIDRRMLATWLSFDDLERLIIAGLRAPVVGHSIVYGRSDNHGTFWDNRGAAHLGWRPRDSSEPWRAELEARQPVIDPTDPVHRLIGGRFVVIGPLGEPDNA
ncbi:NAD-dependent epimerase/dehydratase family protein [Pseudaquabacterium rugosum]|jgi:uronate dehydrogenase|uniref:NAD(P)-dependent oxidoreductase n=1 Tax=Pseudaquabacterium rugosum TaxID=2984194 RepID=A0ABU9BDA6_9BURK